MPEAALRLTPGVARALVEHAARCAPREACGLVAGACGVASAVHFATNVADRDDRYAIATGEQMRLRAAIARAGMDVMAVYHSHVDAPAWPSPRDVALSFVPRLPHVIVGPVRGETQIRAFLLDASAPPDGRIAELRVAVGDASAAPRA